MRLPFSQLILGLILLAGGIAVTRLDPPPQATQFLKQFFPPDVLSQSKPQASPSIAPNTSPHAQLEQAIFEQVNRYRSNRGLSALTLDSRISNQSRIHSQNMSEGKVPFSHQGFEQRANAIATSIRLSSVAENVAFNKGYSQPDRQAVQGWLKSPGHLANIEGRYNLTGIGITQNAKGEYYFTQIFVKT